MLSMGIVGLPNVGKSTLFNSLIKKRKAPAMNYPFCTIKPNVGVVEVFDERFFKLAEMSRARSVVPAAIEFVDIAGLAKNASKGEGLGNQFLADIREVDAILEVVRFFEDGEIMHVEGELDCERDREVVDLELALADLEVVSKRLDKAYRAARAGDKDEKKIFDILGRVKISLEKGDLASEAGLNDDEKFAVKSLSLLTLKPILCVANVSEEQFRTGSWKKMTDHPERYLPICAKIEEELIDLDRDDSKKYLESINAGDSGLDRLIKESYRTLDLIAFFTVGEEETKAWKIRNGTKASEAAGEIHSDFERGFIRAEVINWKVLLEAGSELAAVERGLIKGEGRDYIVRDGDCITFKFNV
ncbi:redox-regulated ATPase YchF [Candidatus Desantisbacteria bacterium CG_4_10_14_0_8_um_filter_48_22]|uniref:Ribosome-binding ATPase YchF n=1 Tax=Candidatus Desantisbacteria bacterium CG_4_10_14_0_8_um_filter_48_22 TaxID=1974543 RepID=A0A2M7SDY6_9BACT|nr:MAG: redox-regulated ATPase YchF [Candidatus Desantisbacteria bacterium CG1_02_49_89]PIV56754.1 MAG: redox-regulated ATPase YchF [Candidatus Desantisbacteria bacterium CG02_land_8_20_14_3_00_49_13]PIZ17680.1 MAG: redox-regulated ATPase YchF [Candidatus Desantisbacteria bacterium CG_4_10_14_0_8_um_filter_48_22]